MRYKKKKSIDDFGGKKYSSDRLQNKQSTQDAIFSALCTDALLDYDIINEISDIIAEKLKGYDRKVRDFQYDLDSKTAVIEKIEKIAREKIRSKRFNFEASEYSEQIRSKMKSQENKSPFFKLALLLHHYIPDIVKEKSSNYIPVKTISDELTNRIGADIDSDTVKITLMFYNKIYPEHRFRMKGKNNAVL